MYTCPFDNIPTGAVADTYKTIAIIQVADTAGSRIRATKVVAGPADDTPADKTIGLRIMRVADVSAGSAGGGGTTIAAGSVPKKDAAAPDSPASLRIGPTSEPSTFEANPLWLGAMNDRGGIIDVWSEDSDKPHATQDQLLALQGAPRTAAAVRISGSIEFELY